MKGQHCHCETTNKVNKLGTTRKALVDAEICQFGVIVTDNGVDNKQGYILPMRRNLKSLSFSSLSGVPVI